LQYLYRAEGFSLQANYSWTHSNDDDLQVYDVPQQSGQFIGAPAHVGNAWLSLSTPVAHLSAMLGARYVGSRQALDFDPVLAQTQPDFPLSMQRLDAEFTVNAALRYEIRATTLTLGVDNLFEEEQYMPQPYSGFSTPFPYGSRSIWLRAEWEWP
ncbi:MAG: TonB-dependent receptor domain-containing protein, partial [Pseudomonadota bacterium]